MEKHSAANSHPFLLLLKDSEDGVRSSTLVNCCNVLALVVRKKEKFQVSQQSEINRASDN